MAEDVIQFRCRGCNAVLVETPDTNQIRTETAIFQGKIEIRCVRCRKLNIWRPSEKRPQPVDSTARPVQNSAS